MSGPRITIGVPLYRSKFFVGQLRRNFKALADEEDVSVLVSDRHGFDDTIDVLHEEWEDDPRFRFTKADDRLNWIEHMNWLLNQADGEYFRWAPHDDIFPAGCVEPLARRLDSDPGAILAYGPTRAIDAGGVRRPGRDRLNTHPVARGGRWTLANSLDLFWRGFCDGAFKGLFRRAPIVDAGLFIRPTRDLIFAERAWLFGVSLLGGLAEEPSSEYYKRYHCDSMSASWSPGLWHVISTTIVMCGYLRDFGPAGSARQRGYIHQWLQAVRLIRHRLRIS